MTEELKRRTNERLENALPDNDTLLYKKILIQMEKQTIHINSIQGYVAFAFWLWIIVLAFNFLGGFLF